MLQIIITSGIIYLAVLVVIFITANQDKPTDENVVKLHPIFLVIGIIGFVLFAALTVLMILKSEFTAAWVFLAAGILASLMILGYFNSRIFFSKTSMTCRNLFRKKTVIPYREILFISDNIIDPVPADILFVFSIRYIDKVVQLIGEDNNRLTVIHISHLHRSRQLFEV